MEFDDSAHEDASREAPKQIGFGIARKLIKELQTLPAQDEIDYEQIRNQPVSKDLNWKRAEVDPIYRDAIQRYGTVESFLSDVSNWKEVFPNTYITEYIRLCFFYGFKPDLPKKAQRNLEYEIDAEYPDPEQNVDFQTLDKAWDAHLFSPLPIDEIGLSKNFKALLKQEGIETISDYIMISGRTLVKRGLNRPGLKKITAFLRVNYEIDKTIIAACPTLINALGIKRRIRLAAETSPITPLDKADQ